MKYEGQKILCVPRMDILRDIKTDSRICRNNEDPHLVRISASSLKVTDGMMHSYYGQNEIDPDIPLFRLDLTIKPSLIDLKMFELPRCLAEGNMSFQQIVVAAIIRSGDKVLLLHNKKGDMKDAKDEVYTTVAGHCEIPDGKTIFSNFYEILIDNLMREFGEELGYDFKGTKLFQNLFFNNINIGGNTYTNFVSNIKVSYIATAFNDFCDMENEPDISFFHLGYIFEINLPPELDLRNFYSNEPDKNDVVLVDLNNKGEAPYINIDDIIDNCDSWVKLILS